MIISPSREYVHNIFGEITAAKETYRDGTEKRYYYTYDDCGNPLKYRGYEMTWDTAHGCLESVKKNNVTYTYNYFSDVQRLSKTVNEKETTFIYNAGMLLAQENEAYRLNFYYDADGIVTEIGYHTYSYLSDGQHLSKTVDGK